MSSRTATAPIGIEPLVSALAMVIMSGKDHHGAVRSASRETGTRWSFAFFLSELMKFVNELKTELAAQHPSGSSELQRLIARSCTA